MSARPPRCSASRSRPSAAGRPRAASGWSGPTADSDWSTIDEVARLLDERRKASTDRPIVAQSARNRFPGIVTRIERDRVAAVVEVIAGPHRLVSLMTAEAVEELDLKVGDEAVCVVKATNVIVEIPSSRESRA